MSQHSIILKLHALQSWARRRRGDTSVNLFTASLLSKWLRLPVIKALNILKLFNHRSQDLSKVDVVLIHSAVKMTRRSSIHTALAALRAACNYSFAFMSRFSQYVTFLTEPDHTTYINLDFHYQMMDTLSSALAKFHVLSWFVLVTTYSALP